MKAFEAIGCALFFLVFVALGVGWVKNILNIAATETVENAGLFVAQLLGVMMVPLGIILGYVV